jgi:hypothetical protein
MEKVVKEKTVSYTMYTASDGVEFHTEEECLKYEQSALFAAKVAFDKIAIKRGMSSYDLFHVGPEDDECVCVAMNTREDMETVLHYFYLCRPYLMKDEYEKYRKDLEITLSEALDRKDLVIFSYYNYDSISLIDSRDNINHRMFSYETEEEK